jgi:F-type H+-transporting ATPase subunit gamma
MAGTKEIKRRIKSVKSTKKITKAMELVSASKMKRAISATLSSRPYSMYSWEVLQSLAEHVEESTNPLLEVRDVKKTLVVFITSNRSLCGGYNSQVTRKVISLLRQNETPIGNSYGEIEFVSIGSKGEASLRRLGQKIVASFNDLSDKPALSNISPISNFIIDLYKKKEYDKVVVAYTDFVSALTQTPRINTLLPVKKEDLKEEMMEEVNRNEKSSLVQNKKVDYTFEPSYESLMSVIVEKIAKMRMYQMILESTASEHSARMLAMKNASDAAADMIDDLTLSFNKARQGNITQEISEISAGMASVS